jgi:hypothetical protein
MPIPMLCIYRVKPGREDEFEKILAKHWRTLYNAGLTTDSPARCYFGTTKDGSTQAFIEMFEWKDANSPNGAHSHPEIMAVWGPMAELCTSMEFLALKEAAQEAEWAERPRRR